MSAAPEINFRPSLLVHADKTVAKCGLKVN